MVAFSTKSSMCFTFPIVTAGSRAGSIAKIFVVGGDCTVADVEVTDNVREAFIYVLAEFVRQGEPPPPLLTENQSEKKKVFFPSGKGGYPPPLNGKSAKLFRETFS